MNRFSTEHFITNVFPLGGKKRRVLYFLKTFFLNYLPEIFISLDRRDYLIIIHLDASTEVSINNNLFL